MCIHAILTTAQIADRVIDRQYAINADYKQKRLFVTHRKLHASPLFSHPPPMRYNEFSRPCSFAIQVDRKQMRVKVKDASGVSKMDMERRIVSDDSRKAEEQAGRLIKQKQRYSSENAALLNEESLNLERRLAQIQSMCPQHDNN
uniref:DUF4140 domain-containing protein n=1 Tax=Ascaris lumbricoides TaxID=6252 RepID=A0A0M3HPD4_ASCLU